MSTVCERAEDEIIRLVYIGGHRLSADVTADDIAEAEHAYRKIAEIAGYMAGLCEALRRAQPEPVNAPY